MSVEQSVFLGIAVPLLTGMCADLAGLQARYARALAPYGFRFYWRWKSHRGRGGRPSIDPEIKKLIRTMSGDNVGWGAPRIHGEFAMLGINVSQATVAKYMIRLPKPPSQTW